MAVAEATALAEAAGVDVTKIPQVLAGGRADSAILQEYMPRFAARDYRRTGRIDNMVKDLNGAQDLAQRTHTAMPMTALCTEIHRMLTAAGLGGRGSGCTDGILQGTTKGLVRMITRYALFEGTVQPGQTKAFRAAVLAEMLPVWRCFPGALATHVAFADDREEGAPEFPLILAIDWLDHATMDVFLDHPIRKEGRAATEGVLQRSFTRRIHHHDTNAPSFAPA